MNWKLTSILVIVVVALIFLVPVVPAVALTPGIAQIVNHPVYSHYYKSISGVFTSFGTSFYKGEYYFRPSPFRGIYG